MKFMGILLSLIFSFTAVEKAKAANCTSSEGQIMSAEEIVACLKPDESQQQPFSCHNSRILVEKACSLEDQTAEVPQLPVTNMPSGSAMISQKIAMGIAQNRTKEYACHMANQKCQENCTRQRLPAAEAQNSNFYRSECQKAFVAVKTIVDMQVKDLEAADAQAAIIYERATYDPSPYLRQLGLQ